MVHALPSRTRARRRLVLLAGSLLGLAGTAASAAPVVFEYLASGHGATVSGTFGYDDAAADGSPSPTLGLFAGAGFLTGAVVGGPQDGVAFSASGLNVFVLDDSPVGAAGEFRWADSFQLGESGPAYNYIAFVSELVAEPGPAAVPPLDSDQLADPDLAARLEALAGWNLDRYVSVCPAGCRPNYTYDLVSVRRVLAPVPEPAGGVLAGIGVVLAFAHWAARRKGGKAVRRLGG